MRRPAVIELTFRDNTHLYIIFQNKSIPLLSEEIRGDEIWVNKCPDDGTLFLEGSPEDYIDATIRLNPPNATLWFTLTADEVQTMKSARTCSFGDIQDIEAPQAGPGFTYRRGLLQHDSSIGVSSESSILREAMSSSSGIIVLIDRPGHHEVKKYYDEEGPSVERPESEGPKGPENREDDAEDVDMDANGTDDQGAAQDQTASFASDLSNRMKTLRLKGK